MLLMMGIRERHPDDIAALTRIIDSLAADRYPPHRPDDAEVFVAARDELASFVYEIESDIVGHVAVHQSSARSVMALASQRLSVPVEQLAAVARLFVSPSARRTGIARALLDRAVEFSHGAGRRPVLDVWEGLQSAIALYTSAGWKLLGSTRIEFRSACTNLCSHDGTSITSFVYASPDRRQT